MKSREHFHREYKKIIPPSPLQVPKRFSINELYKEQLHSQCPFVLGNVGESTLSSIYPILVNANFCIYITFYHNLY